MAPAGRTPDSASTTRRRPPPATPWSTRTVCARCSRLSQGSPEAMTEILDDCSAWRDLELEPLPVYRRRGHQLAPQGGGELARSGAEVRLRGHLGYACRADRTDPGGNCVHPRRPGPRRCRRRRAGTPAHLHGGQAHRRHGGGSPVVPRALVVAFPPLVSTAALWSFRDHTSSSSRRWVCGGRPCPRLAFTGRLSVWGHTAWVLAYHGGPPALVHVAWLITSTGLSVPAALGCWALWAVVAAAFVLFAVWARRPLARRSVGAAVGSGSSDGAPTGVRAALRERRDLTTPRPWRSPRLGSRRGGCGRLALVLQPENPQLAAPVRRPGPES